MTKRLSFMASVFLAAFGMMSSVRGEEPSEPEGATPLNAEQIKATFAGYVFKGQNLDYVDQHFKDGLFKGEFHSERYTGKWWVDEKDDYLCQLVFGKKHCYNIARAKDGKIYFYLWGAYRPDVWGTLEPINGSD